MSAFTVDYSGALDSPFALDESTIPPPLDTVGPISSSLEEIYERTAERLHVSATDPWLVDAVDAAVEFVIGQTGREAVGLPDDAPTRNGLVVFGEAIYLDQHAPNGTQTAFSDPNLEALYRTPDIRRYFRRLYVSWGIG